MYKYTTVQFRTARPNSPDPKQLVSEFDVQRATLPSRASHSSSLLSTRSLDMPPFTLT
jgi:hypothetical protein